MKISIDTETEEISELKSLITIIEDAIKRREDPNEETIEEATSEPEPITEQEINTEPTTQTPKPEPSVDISSLSMSDYGQEVENRNLNNIQEQDSKTIVKEIILSLSKQNPNQPIQMSDIISKCCEKNIQDEEARKLVDELKDSGEI